MYLCYRSPFCEHYFKLAWKVAAKFDLTSLTATMDKGLLIIDIPVSEERAPKKIQILVPKKK